MIVELLKEGEENKVSFEYLKRRTGYKNERTVRKIIAEERKQGAIILSCPKGGYYLPKNKEEVENYVKFISKEAKTSLYNLKPCRSYLNNDENQLSFIE